MNAKKLQFQSEHIGTRGANTNERICDIPDPIISRYIVLTFNTYARENYSVIDKMAQSKIISSSQKNATKRDKKRLFFLRLEY